MKFLVRAFAIAATLLSSQAVAGDDPAYDRFFIMPTVSTLGGGVEAGYRINPGWQVRAGISGGALSFVYHDRDSDLHSRATLLSGGITVDHFPFEDDFYLSGGLRLSANRIEGRVRNLHGKLKNGASVVAANPLTTYSVRQNTFQPYLGAGYSVKLRERLSLNFDLGLLYAGTPELEVNSRAHLLGFSRHDIAREIERAQNRLAPFKVYPVAQLGLKFDF
jgi:hypothetical protein